MATLIVVNLKKLHETTFSTYPVDSTMYRQLIGSLLYLVHTRLDICFVVCTLSQVMTNLRHVRWVASKHVLRYLHGTIGYGLRYTFVGGVRLSGYTGSDCNNSAVDHNSTSRYYFSMGSAIISWSSRKHSFVVFTIA